jgi:hypothetical protein
MIAVLQDAIDQGITWAKNKNIPMKWEQASWPAAGSEDTELGVLMELEVSHGETEVYARVQA